jgi:hypothetical protein
MSCNGAPCFIVTCTCNGPVGQKCDLEFDIENVMQNEVFQIPITATNNPVIVTSSLITCSTTLGEYVVAMSTDPSVVINNGGPFDQIVCVSTP